MTAWALVLWTGMQGVAVQSYPSQAACYAVLTPAHSWIEVRK